MADDPVIDPDGNVSGLAGMPIVLPPGVVPLTFREFAGRFAPIMPTFIEHVAARIKQSNEKTFQVLERASTPGDTHILQFGARDDEPGVFTQPHDRLSEHGVAFTDAVISYFDTQGSFNSRTGALTAAEAWGTDNPEELTPYVEELLRQADVIVRQMATYQNTLDGRSQAIQDSAQPAVQKATELRAVLDEVEASRQASRKLTGLMDADPILHRRVAAQLRQTGETPEAFIDRYAKAAVALPEAVPYELVTHLFPGAPMDSTNERMRQLATDYGLDVVAGTSAEGQPQYKVPPATLQEWLDLEAPDAFRRLGIEASCSRRIAEETVTNWYNAGVIHFVKVKGGARTHPRTKLNVTHKIGVLVDDGWPTIVSRTERAIRDAFVRLFNPTDILDLMQGMKDAKVTRNGKDWLVQQLTKEHDRLIVKRDAADAEIARLNAQLGKKDAEIAKLGKKAPLMPLPGKTLPEVIPGEHTYMRAIERQYSVLADLTYSANKARAAGKTMFEDMSIEELFDHDIAALKRAETFCWFEEPIFAVQAAAASMPDTVRLTRDLTTAYAGWWYLTLPLDVETEAAGDAVQALLWSWESRDAGSGVMFSVYINEPKSPHVGDSGLMPSAKFYWPEGLTLAAAMKGVREEHRARYSSEVVSQWAAAYGKTNPMQGEEEMAQSVERLFRFFAAGCLWVQQKILVYSKGHIERHARKRLEKEHDRPMSDVQVIQLRRTESTGPAPERTGEEKHIDWKCRWIVGGTQGFWRDQYYPSEGLHKPKWIAPFMKGPADKPLKVPTHRVNVVNR